MSYMRMRHIAAVITLFVFAGTAQSGGKPEGTADLDEALTITETDAENGMDAFEVCTACHGINGWGKPDGTYPQLAGQHTSALIKAMTDIRAGNRDNPTMYPYTLPHALGGAQDIADMVAYVTQLKMDPDNGKGSGENLTHGEELYKKDCTACHGTAGEGVAEAGFPGLAGQHFNYLKRQFEWIRDGKRRNANPAMIEAIKRYKDEDILAVMDYVSRLSPPKDKLAPSADWENPDYD